MSDPRAAITRTVLAPPPPASRPPQATHQTPRPAEEQPSLIGKPHGRMRSVNLALTEEARAALYSRAAEHSVTLGEALMDAIEASSVSTARWRGGRAEQRKGVRTSIAYVLLTNAEAMALAARATAAGRTLSDYASVALSSQAA